MDTSVKWLNDYLDPIATADEQAELLTRAGFPLEGATDIPDVEHGDVRQDYEMTSNRGDCVCHFGLAREIAAISGRSLKAPDSSVQASGPPASDFVTLENRDFDGCPLYAARIIRGVTVGPSPKWLADRLIARGDIPRNNIVDAANFVLFELGQPTHVFDLATLAGPKIIIRRAEKDEPFLPIGEGESQVKLTTDDLVIADANQPVALAGVKGGALSAVTDSTTDILIEAATFNFLTVRNTSRRHNIASDSSYRFERGVHPGAVVPASDRLCRLILELAGGELCQGIVSDGAPIPDPQTASMRPDRCRRILGIDLSDDDMIQSLDRLGFAPKRANGTIQCTVPVHRLDIEREIDLIEEVTRMQGLDRIEIADTIDIRVAPPQPRDLARRAVADELVGMGFIETINSSLITDAAADAFMPPGMSAMRVSDDRAKAAPALRPSILPSLIRVYQHNHDHGSRDVRLFETASTFARLENDSHLETRNLGILHPSDVASNPLRFTRGVIERLVSLLQGPDAHITVEPLDNMPWLQPGAAVRLNGDVIGVYGVLAPHILKAFDLDEGVCGAELGLPAFYDDFPPDRQASRLSHHPSIKRDLSLIVAESITWQTIIDTVEPLNLLHLEGIEYITIYRGKQIGDDRKSVTLQLRFRSADRTLQHEEVSGQMEQAIGALTNALDAEIRA